MMWSSVLLVVILLLVGKALLPRNRLMGVVLLALATLLGLLFSLRSLRPPTVDTNRMRQTVMAYHDIAGRYLADHLERHFSDDHIVILLPPHQLDRNLKAFIDALEAGAANNKYSLVVESFSLSTIIRDRIMGTVADWPANEAEDFVRREWSSNYSQHIRADDIHEFITRKGRNADLIMSVMALPPDWTATFMRQHEIPPLILLFQDRPASQRALDEEFATAAVVLRDEVDVWTLPDPRRTELSTAFNRRFEWLTSASSP